MMLFIMRELRLGIESFVGKALALDEGNDPERFGPNACRRRPSLVWINGPLLLSIGSKSESSGELSGSSSVIGAKDLPPTLETRFILLEFE